jgi:hypothetical protein
MSRPSFDHSATEPSFFYVLMAESCFRRAACTRRPQAVGTLRQTGRDYLAKANGMGPVLERQSSPSRRASTHYGRAA